jgi:hypothetical protein
MDGNVKVKIKQSYSKKLGVPAGKQVSLASLMKKAA